MNIKTIREGKRKREYIGKENDEQKRERERKNKYWQTETVREASRKEERRITKHQVGEKEREGRQIIG